MQTTTLTIATRNDPVIFTTPARFAALRARGLYFPASVECRAMQLAERSTYSTRLPGIYKCGGSIVDSWRGACSCKEYRKHPGKPCVHQLAVWIGTLYEVWKKRDQREINFHASYGIHMPDILYFTCSFKGTRGRFKISLDDQPAAGPWWTATNMTTGETTFFMVEDITRLTPIYEE